MYDNYTIKKGFFTMLKTKKFLYILPEVTYSIEFVEDKNSGRFFIHSFRQINGQFMDGNVLFSESLKKLFQKIDEDEYNLILPDFAFTDTIVNVPESEDVKIAQYLKENLLPNIAISEKTHQIRTSILMQRSDISKIQISALEKSFIAPLYQAIGNKNIEISNISPLNWTIKTLISLEPSISIIQLGNRLYLAEHYIGINQTNYALIEDCNNLIETIKTIKGSESNIQTVYLLTNALIEKKIRNALAKTIPIQQLADNDDSSNQIPSYVKEVIESGAKTLALEDFPLPLFSFDKNKILNLPIEDLIVPEIEIEESNNAKENMKKVKKLEIFTENLNDESVTEKDEVGEVVTRPISTIKSQSTTAKIDEVAEVADEIDITNTTKSQDIKEEGEDKKTLGEVVNEQEEIHPKIENTTKTGSDQEKVSSKLKPNENQDEVVDPLSKFAIQNQENSKSRLNSLNDNSGSKRIFKAITTFLTVTVVVIIAGILVSAGLLKLIGADIPFNLNFFNKEDPSQNSSASNQTIQTLDQNSEATDEIKLEATNEAEEKEEIKKDEFKILVVNATSIAGHAGKIKTTLVKDGFKNITASNAKGDYEKFNYLLINEEDKILIEVLNKVLDTKLEIKTDKKTEDPSNKYDFIIVLGK
jgi:hypothetical protein